MIRSISTLAVLAASLAPSTAIEAAGTPHRRPNVVLLMADDLGWGDVGFNGNPTIRTPHLDAMAAAGLRFDRFYAASPVCSPTRGSCLTGRHPSRYGITSANVGHLPAGETTLAEALGTLGYATGHFGKWHLGTLSKTVPDSNRGGPEGAEHYAPPREHGFDSCFSTEAKVPTWDPMLRPRGVGRNTWWDPVSAPSEAEPYGTSYWADGERVADGLRGDDSRLIMDRALRFIRGASAEGLPFFAVIWFHAPHLPVVAGPEYTAMYPGEDDYARHYYGCITAMDEQVGRLRGTLRELGEAEDSLLFFCSDNGPEGQAGSAPGSAGPFRGRKRSLFEGGIRVPAVAEWPSTIEPGRATDLPCVTSDYLPTVLDLVDDRPEGLVEPIDGVSLRPLLEGRAFERPGSIGFEFNGQLALIGPRHKLIHVPGPGRPGDDRPAEGRSFQLFDLIADPAEGRDLADDRPELVRSMASTLADWRRSCAASRRDQEDPGLD